MDIAKLRAELQTDPEQLGYAGKTPAELVQMLNAPTRPGVLPIPGTELAAWAGGGSTVDTPCRKIRIDQAAAGNVPATDQVLASLGTHRNAVVGAAVAAQVLFTSPGETALDLRLPSRRQLLNALVAGGVLAAAEAAELYQLSAASRAEELGIGFVELKHMGG